VPTPRHPVVEPQRKLDPGSCGITCHFDGQLAHRQRRDLLHRGVGDEIGHVTAAARAQAAPTLPLSNGPPISAVFPSADSATLEPKFALYTGFASLGVSFYPLLKGLSDVGPPAAAGATDVNRTAARQEMPGTESESREPEASRALLPPRSLRITRNG
jgi:hypothetical protein